MSANAMGIQQSADDERTVIASATNRVQPRNLGELSFELRGRGLNPFVDAATALLNLAVRIRTLSGHNDIEGLRLLVMNEVKTFEQSLSEQSYDWPNIIAARYALCAMIDEAVLSTDWGSGSSWGSQSLLSYFYNETWGGEKFYLILNRLLQEPQKHIEMIELLYVCIALGFRGKYAIMDNGEAKLDKLMDNLYDLLRRHRGEGSDQLADHLQGVRRHQHRLAHWISPKLVIVTTTILLLGGYVWLNSKVTEAVAPVKTQLETLAEASK
jgi:type VI secretion system protein ImpK